MMMARQTAEAVDQNVSNESEANREELQQKDDAALLRTMGYKPVSTITYMLLLPRSMN